jgi:hypothetical protein
MHTSMRMKTTTARACSARPVLTRHSTRVARPVRSVGLRVVAELPTLPLSWGQIASQTKNELGDYHLRSMQSPSSSPTTTLPAEADAHLRSKKQLVLYRDTNAWCPYCQRVGYPWI